ncbi:MAG: carbon storage regulator [Planctomycetales bacterium]|nr:carbon storage regulator [Planctomycetales bacterium]
MLVLSRKPNQSIRIGDSITVNIVRIKGNTLQIGIEAPREVTILRAELLEKDARTEAGRVATNEGAAASDGGQSNDRLELNDRHLAGSSAQSGTAGSREPIGVAESC